MNNILKFHNKYTAFSFGVEEIDKDEIYFLEKANSMVLSHMNVKNFNCFTFEDSVLSFIIGGDCSKHEEVLQRNIAFGLDYMGVPNSYLGMVVHVP